MKTNNDNSTNITQMMVLFAVLWSGGFALNEAQVATITNILMSAISHHGSLPTIPAVPNNTPQGDTVRGMSELAELLGVSLPTACKISKTGIFDAARLDVGTKKFVWNKAKLLELAKKK